MIPANFVFNEDIQSDANNNEGIHKHWHPVNPIFMEYSDVKLNTKSIEKGGAAPPTFFAIGMA
jgi:hypothetical protein